MQVIDSFKDQVPITKRLQWSGMNPSNFYYKLKNGKPGRKPSLTSLKTDGSVAANHEIVEEIKNILGIEFYVMVISLLLMNYLTGVIL